MTDQETLQKLHSVQLEIMDEIHRLCEKYEIEYFLDSGSALGAIRHNGFIPWDDDIDVGMLREYYDKFIQVACKDLSDKYVLQTADSDPAYNHYNSKIRKKNTIYPEPGSVNYKYRGIFIDIFPFDYINDDITIAYKEMDKARLLYRLILSHQSGHKSSTISHKIFHYLLQIVPLSFIKKKYLQLILKYNKIKTKSVTCYSYKMQRTMNLFFSKNDISPVVLTKFEGRYYYIMKNSHSYLTKMFQDYMKLPPEEKRQCHFNGQIKF